MGFRFKSCDKQTYTQPRCLTADVSCVKDVWTRIGEVTCPAGQIWDMGYARNLGQSDSLGRLFFAPINTPGAAAMNGSLRIYREDSNGLPAGIVFEGHTSELTATEANRLTQRVFENKNKKIKEDSKYVFWFKNDDATATIDADATKLFADGMRYML